LNKKELIFKRNLYFPDESPRRTKNVSRPEIGLHICKLISGRDSLIWWVGFRWEETRAGRKKLRAVYHLKWIMFGSAAGATLERPRTRRVITADTGGEFKKRFHDQENRKNKNYS